MQTVELEFDLGAYSVDAVERALYRFSDRAAGELRVGERSIHCVLTLRATDVSADEIVFDLRNEVLDQTLRERIRRETESARNLILSIAFSQTDLIGS